MEITKKILDKNDYGWIMKEVKYIILHHTWTNTNYKNVETYFDKDEVYASSHYIIWKKWEIDQLVPLENVARHAGKSSWDWIQWLNSCSIWIEVNSDWYDFTDIQRKNTTDLVLYLMKKFNIPAKNVLRHKDIAPNRKWDIWENFYKKWIYKGIKIYSDYQKLLNINSMAMWFYENHFKDWSCQWKSRVLNDIDKFIKETEWNHRELIHWILIMIERAIDESKK